HLAIAKAREEVEQREATMRLRAKRQVLLREIPGEIIYLEANNRFFSLISELREIFGDLKIVHIIRDGRDYVRSGLSRPGNWHWYDDNDPWANRGLRLKATMFPDDPYHDEWA
ncbi:MAG: hypothetical protein ABEJ65_12625, partial [bacterium]